MQFVKFQLACRLQIRESKCYFSTDFVKISIQAEALIFSLGGNLQEVIKSVLSQKNKKKIFQNTVSIRKHAHSNILKILQPKEEKFQIKSLIFFISLIKT